MPGDNIGRSSSRLPPKPPRKSSLEEPAERNKLAGRSVISPNKVATRKRNLVENSSRYEAHAINTSVYNRGTTKKPKVPVVSVDYVLKVIRKNPMTNRKLEEPSISLDDALKVIRKQPTKPSIPKTLTISKPETIQEKESKQAREASNLNVIDDADNDLADLMLYVKYNRLEFIKAELKEKESNVNLVATSSSSGTICTALISAIKHGRTEIIHYLLEHGADPNLTNETGFTPLMMARKQGNLEVCRMLIDKGADISAKDYRHETALMKVPKKMIEPVFATDVVKPPIANITTDSKTKTTRQVTQDQATHSYNRGKDKNSFGDFLAAAKTGNLNEIKLILDKGIDFSASPSFRSKSADVILAIGLLTVIKHSGDLDVIKYLLKKGATLNLHDKDGYLPITLALKQGNLKIVKILRDWKQKHKKP